jgi:hypothetical protein
MEQLFINKFEDSLINVFSNEILTNLRIDVRLTKI